MQAMCKKMILLRPVGAALAVLTLVCLMCVSCSSDDTLTSATPDGNRRPMAFSVATADYAGITRGTPSEDLYESMGLYAHIYDGTAGIWENGGGSAPNFMVNAEVQNAGDVWMTVGAFDLMESDRAVRFYAYYPFGHDSISVTDETHANAPVITYKVPLDVDEQKDLLAGSSFDGSGSVREYSTDTQNGDNPETVQLTLSHILTAVKFQVGECREVGRIKNITITSILRQNSYSLQRKSDDSGFYGWAVKHKDEVPEYFSDFSIDLDKQIKVTQRDASNNVVPQEVTNNKQWLLMIPQTLSEDSWLTISYYCGGSEHQMSVAIDGKKWQAGKKVTYTLNILSLQRLMVNSSVEDWDAGLEFSDGRPTTATSIDSNTNVDDWDCPAENDKDIASDDPRD